MNNKGKGWNFPSNGGGETAGANNAAIDAFSGTILSSLVREVIQNSLDAKVPGDNSVEVYFDLKSLSIGEFDGFSELIPHILSCQKIAYDQGDESTEKLYGDLVKEMQEKKSVDILCVHDANTCGLKGEIDKPSGPWFALTKGAGMSQKSSSGSLGSYGHGSKASFAISKARCVFYYTKIKQEGSYEKRFQGKSILQSHYWPSEGRDLTQGTGFYGKRDNNLPLLNEEIPPWAVEFRERKLEGIGTSLYIPYTLYNAEWVPETIITVVANFFFAIQNKKLIVYVSGKRISHENLEKVYEECKRKLPEEQDEIDAEHVRNCFKSIDTILDCQNRGEQQIPGFGNIAWYLRMSEDVDWRAVAIARASGMLITRRAPKLQRFPGTKHFDLFVCVLGKEGSELLKKLENPQHNNFEFDRIRNLSERETVKKEYDKFAKKIKGIISSYAFIDSEEEESIPEFDYLFHDFSEQDTSPNSQSERGEQMLILDGPIARSKNSYAGKESESLEVLGGAFGRGLQGGVGEKTGEGGDIADPEGTAPIQTGVPSDEGSPSNERLSVRNFRVCHLREGNRAILYFDPPETGEYEFVVYRSGENGNEVATINVDGMKSRGVIIKVEKEKRQRLNLQFTSNISRFALEAALHKKS